VLSFSTVWPSTICGWGAIGFVQAIQRVEHHTGVDVRPPGGTPDWIEQGQPNSGNVLERSFAFGPRDMRRGENRRTDGQP